jgi:PAS domain S-box-containing protein
LHVTKSGMNAKEYLSTRRGSTPKESSMALLLGDVDTIPESASKQVLVHELASLRQRVRELETLDANRRWTEKALKESEQRLRLLLESTEDIIVAMLDLQGRCLYYNGPSRYGLKPEDVIGKTPADFLDPSIAASVLVRVKHVAALRQSLNFEQKVPWRRNTLWFLTQISPVLDKSGEVSAVVFFSRNISERKRAEESLRLANILLERTFASLKEAVFVMDLSAQAVITCNTAVEHIFGYKKEEVIGKTLEFLHLSKANYDEFNEGLSSALKGEGLFNAEFPARCKDGTSIMTEYTVTETSDDSSGRAVLVIVARDITERKRAEEQLKIALKEKEVLLKEIHHRVKNNLAVISSLLNMQSKYIKDKKTLEIFRESQNRVKTMALIHTKLYQSSDLARIDFADYVRKLAADLIDSYRLEPDAVTLLLDVRDVFFDVNVGIPCGLIINELLTNALKHAFPSGRKGEVSVSLRPEEERITLAVADNGIGFPENIDFRNTESLGFQLVTALVDQLGGTIELAGEKGTRFVISFPK